MNRYYIGMDIGATNVRIAVLYSEEEKLVYQKKFKFFKCNDVLSEVNKNLCEPIADACSSLKTNGNFLAGIGIATAALFDRKNGVITKWPNNQKWNGFCLKEYLEEKFQVPVTLEDDANAAALGEYYFGEGIGINDFVYITVSTGIGCGIIYQGKIFVGHNGWAGEFGHIKVTDKKIKCKCGAYGCLQAIASGTAMLQSFKDTLFYKNKLCEISIDLKDVVKLAENGVSEATQIFYVAGLEIGKGIANLVLLFDVADVVLGGGAIEAGELILKPIREGIEESLQNKRGIHIKTTKLKDENGVLGALALIRQIVEVIS